MENPAAAPTVVTAEFSDQQDASGGLHRLHDGKIFMWASRTSNLGGTVYRIESF